MVGILEGLPPPDREGVGDDGQPSYLWKRGGGRALRLRLGPSPELTEFRGRDAQRTSTGSYAFLEVMAKQWFAQHGAVDSTSREG